MKKTILFFLLSFLAVLAALGQEKKHTEKFEQLEYELRDPNEYRTASGAPGHKYWQNEADYQMEIVLDDNNQTISGVETITYKNNSPDVLKYLWLQLDQNVRAKDSHSYNTNTNQIEHNMLSNSRGGNTVNNVLDPSFDGGFKIAEVTGVDGNDLPFIINKTMMSVDMFILES